MVASTPAEPNTVELTDPSKVMLVNFVVIV
jgi:hypothetical protein